MARNDRPSFYFFYLAEIDHLAEIPILTRFEPSHYATYLRMHVDSSHMVAQPKVLNPLQGWVPGDPTMEPIIHSWSRTEPTQWN